MIAEAGRFFVIFGLAFAVASTIIAIGLAAAGLPIPDILVRASAFAAFVSGDVVKALGTVATYAGIAVGLAGIMSILRMIFRGEQTFANLLQPIGFAAYIALFTIATNACVSVVSMLLDAYASATGATVVLVFKATITAFIMFCSAYYILARLGLLPAE